MTLFVGQQLLRLQSINLGCTYTLLPHRCIQQRRRQRVLRFVFVDSLKGNTIEPFSNMMNQK